MDWTSILARVRARAGRWLGRVRVPPRQPVAPRAGADVVPLADRASRRRVAVRATADRPALRPLWVDDERGVDSSSFADDLRSSLTR